MHNGNIAIPDVMEYNGYALHPISDGEFYIKVDGKTLFGYAWELVDYIDHVLSVKYKGEVN